MHFENSLNKTELFLKLLLRMEIRKLFKYKLISGWGLKIIKRNDPW